MKPKVKKKSPHKMAQRFAEIPINRVLHNPEQPRKHFDPGKLKELTRSVTEHGVMKPILVEEVGSGNGDYILHDGERRLRASKIAGLKLISAMISAPLNGAGPQERLVRALVANIQNEEMSPVDEGLAYRRMRDEFGWSNREISKRTGKPEVVISRRVLMTELEPEIQELWRAKKLSTEDKAVRALRSLPSKGRIEFAHELAARRATAKVIVDACHRFNQIKGEKSSVKEEKDTPAERLSRNLNKPEWDALYQLGKVPPWPVLNDAVMKTCDTCALRPIASEATCSSCPQVILLMSLLEAINVPA